MTFAPLAEKDGFAAESSYRCFCPASWQGDAIVAAVCAVVVNHVVVVGWVLVAELHAFPRLAVHLSSDLVEADPDLLSPAWPSGRLPAPEPS